MCTKCCIEHKTHAGEFGVHVAPFILSLSPFEGVVKRSKVSTTVVPWWIKQSVLCLLHSFGTRRRSGRTSPHLV